jgi:hypothetical protein
MAVGVISARMSPVGITVDSEHGVIYIVSERRASIDGNTMTDQG